ncbi:MAG: hypothetical protein A2Z66_02615 [Chloroflexi bacterium RBG_13_66_10]|nr:MAG: hypothetical protein A2Z66_02615 [Chloroflexi bacterium RBG_13_66_10]
MGERQDHRCLSILGRRLLRCPACGAVCRHLLIHFDHPFPTSWIPSLERHSSGTYIVCDVCRRTVAIDPLLEPSPPGEPEPE